MQIVVSYAKILRQRAKYPCVEKPVIIGKEKKHVETKVNSLKFMNCSKKISNDQGEEYRWTINTTE